MLALLGPRCCHIHAVGGSPRPQPWSKGPRRLPFHLLVCSLDGREHLEVDGRAHDIPPGGGYLVEAGRSATIGSVHGNRPVFAHFDALHDRHREARRAWAWWREPLGGETMPPPQPGMRAVFGVDLGPAVPTGLHAALGERLPRIVRLWDSGDQLAMVEAAHELEGFLLLWVGHALRAAGAAPPRSPASRIARAEAVALQRLDRPFGLAAFAAAAGLGRSQFCAAYRRLRGESPGAFLRRCRLEQARALLARGAAVGEAARRCGYADRTVFARAFAARFGVPPSRAHEVR